MLTVGMLFWALVICWLPGAVVFRLPWFSRNRRAALESSERLFWQILISVTISLSMVLALALLGRYTFERLLVADVGIAVVIHGIVATNAVSRFGRTGGP